jgi:ubiquinone/menaquinone biosynthesis C-methylase UbiE
MDKEKPLKQHAVNAVWSPFWQTELSASIQSILKQRLFVEGYPVFKKYVPKDARSILDVGAGTGRYGASFARDFPDSTVYVTDMTDESLSLAKRLAEEVGVTNVVFQKEDVGALSFPDDFFDVVFSDVVLQHVPNRADAMKEMTRVLKPDGTLIVSAVNIWNPPHTLYKWLLKILREPYPYGYEKSFSAKEFRDLFHRYHVKVVAEDGFYPAYGMYRWKSKYPIFKLLGRIANRATKILDRLTGRFVSRKLGFEIFCVGRKYAIEVKHSGIIRLPETSDEKNGTLIIGEFDKTIPFPVKRLYHITNMTDLKAVRGGHAHKKTDQVIFCVRGTFRLTLKDGEATQKIYLRNPAYGIRLGPKLWHTMTNFSKDCVIMVLASENYDESDYIRNYDEFLTYIKNNP